MDSSETIIFRFHFHQEWLLVITPWQVLLKHITFLMFCPLLLTTGLESVLLKHDNISFLRTSSLHTVDAGGSVISLAGGFLSWHILLGRCDMLTNFYSQLFFKKNNNGYGRTHGFPWYLARIFDTNKINSNMGTNICQRILLFYILLMEASNTTCSTIFLTLELDKSVKR